MTSSSLAGSRAGEGTRDLPQYVLAMSDYDFRKPREVRGEEGVSAGFIVSVHEVLEFVDAVVVELGDEGAADLPFELLASVLREHQQLGEG